MYVVFVVCDILFFMFFFLNNTAQLDTTSHLQLLNECMNEWKSFVNETFLAIKTWSYKSYSVTNVTNVDMSVFSKF